MKKNKFLSLCFSFIPGAGQMYQGYMKRGLSLIGIVSVIFVFALFINIDALMLLCLVVWMYSFFDSLNLRDQIENNAPPADEYLFNFGDGKGAIEKFVKGNQLVGWALIVLGSFALYQTVIQRFLWNIINQLSYESIVYQVFSRIISGLPSFVVSVVLIWAGVRLVNLGKKKNEAEDYTRFKGGESED